VTAFSARVSGYWINRCFYRQGLHYGNESRIMAYRHAVSFSLPAPDLPSSRQKKIAHGFLKRKIAGFQGIYLVSLPFHPDLLLDPPSRDRE
jgi:hypothetical protein